MLHLNLKIGRKSEDDQLVGLIADEGTCAGFLLAGIGERDKQGQMNFFVVDESKKESEIEMFFNEICQRRDVVVLMIAEDIAKKISQALKSWQEHFPIIVEIPSKKQLFNDISEVTLNDAFEENIT